MHETCQEGVSMLIEHVVPHGRSIRRMLILSLAVIGVVVGILGMHTLMVGAGSTANAHAMQDQAAEHRSHDSEVTASATASAPGGAAYADCAGGSCGSGHDMSTMLCLLALIVTSLLLLAPALVRSGTAFFQAIASRGREFARVLAPERPPSLHALSISRT